MKQEGLSLLLFALILGMGATLWIALAQGEVAQGHGFVDAAFATLRRGGDGPARAAPILWLGWLFGALQIAFFVACLALGLTRGDRKPAGAPFARALWLGGAAFEVVWAALVAVYWRYASSGATDLWLGLPSPTAIMLYGIWLLPLGFCLLYVLRFDSWVLSEAELSSFREGLGLSNPADDATDLPSPSPPDGASTRRPGSQ